HVFNLSSMNEHATVLDDITVQIGVDPDGRLVSEPSQRADDGSFSRSDVQDSRTLGNSKGPKGAQAFVRSDLIEEAPREPLSFQRVSIAEVEGGSCERAPSRR